MNLFSPHTEQVVPSLSGRQASCGGANILTRGAVNMAYCFPERVWGASGSPGMTETEILYGQSREGRKKTDDE